MTNVSAAQSGNRRQALEALRDTLAASIDEAAPADRAPLAAQYRQTLADLAAIPTAEATSTVDQLKEARAKRRAASGPKPGTRKKAN